MNDNCNGGGFNEAVCVHTDKIYDSCRSKDCLENLRVYIPSSYQDTLDNSINIKCTKAEIIWVFPDIDRSKYNFTLIPRPENL